MTTIRITEFAGYTKELFLEFFQAQPLAFTNIIVPKFYGSEDGLFEQVSDYHRALYIGQLLGRISEDILNSCPDPDEPGEFSYIIATTQWEALAELLVWLFKGCDPKEEDPDASGDFEDAALSFLSTLPENEMIYCVLYLDIIENLHNGNDHDL